MDMSLAAETREAVRRQPFVRASLRAGILNYTAAARFLDVSEETEAVATALRRYAEELPDWETEPRRVRVTMQRGVSLVEDALPEDPLLVVNGVGLDADGSGGDLTVLLAIGDVDGRGMAVALHRLAVADVDVVTAGLAGDAIVVAVDSSDSATALRVFEDAFEAVPVES